MWKLPKPQWVLLMSKAYRKGNKHRGFSRNRLFFQEVFFYRYYLKRSSSAGKTPKEGLDEISEILKVFSKRSWQNVTTSKKKPSKKQTFEFTLMSYNVLAQNLLNDHPYLYKHHNRKALDWETRWRNLFNEIKTMKPDILCLQEVQETHLAGYYR